jgi:hypothetical protein
LQGFLARGLPFNGERLDNLKDEVVHGAGFCSLTGALWHEVTYTLTLRDDNPSYNTKPCVVRVLSP